MIKIILISTFFIVSCMETDQNEDSHSKSLTSSEYDGKKFYLGWGHANPGDPENMHNQAKYDVLHTHDIFTKDLGGKYKAEYSVGNGSTSEVEKNFETVFSQVGENDMFVQYSSGHGYPRGLAIGGTYDEISERILSLKAKEIIVFTMACYSGGLVDSFNNKKQYWKDFKEKGRTLFVMASSTVTQESASGPNSSEYPYGKAGSAFGHALWKSLKGEADGYVDGVKDGYIDLAEIEAYTKHRTKQIGGHDPVTTGIYNPQLIMNRVLGEDESKTVSFPNQGTDNMSDQEVSRMVSQEDKKWKGYSFNSGL